MIQIIVFVAPMRKFVMMQLHNKYDRETLQKRLDAEDFERTTISFYRYVKIADPESMRDELYAAWSSIGMLGRIYLAKEGVNAQFSVPSHHVQELRNHLDTLDEFKDMPFKIAVEDDGRSFLKLVIKVKEQIVADGLTEDEYDVSNVGNHLTAEEFNEALDQDGTIVVDMRNHYESEVGHFEGAILPEAETFKEELPMVLEKLRGKEDDKILMYCTGGIRCEKASAYLKHHGFNDVNQLHGGIIDYARQIKAEGRESKYIGKNFVFDERIGERITDDVIAHCHQCGAACDTHVNCANVGCNLLFIQCEQCAAEFDACCTPRCQEIIKLPEEKQEELRSRSEQKKRFNKGLQYPDELKDRIRDERENGFSIDVENA